MPLKLFNTLSKTKEIFTPLNLSHVRMYVCGPTVYDFAHLGNARPVVVFDVLYRLLNALYPRVTYVRNITDVDDKINAAAKSNHETIQTLTERTTKAYHEDMEALNALPPTIEPRATAHIGQMIHMIETLITKTYAYENAGHVLFRHKNYEQYGSLSRRSTEDMISGARVEVAPYKEHPGDFVLWKPAQPDEPGWQSPWGYGRPGWHIECSAMSAVYLGETFDIHGGGIDLIFPHHENEIAQSCAAHGHFFMAKYWVHNGHLMVEGDKMSKSLGNFFTVRDLLAETNGEVIRYTLLSTHYRQPLNFSKAQLVSSKKALDKLYRILVDIYTDTQEVDQDSELIDALLDDMNTPLAFTRLHALAAEYSKNHNPLIAKKIRQSGKLLGLFGQDPSKWFTNTKRQMALSKDEIEELIQKRKTARQMRRFNEADEVRKILDEAGVLLEDTSTGTTWRRK